MTDLSELDRAMGGDGVLLDPGDVPAWVEVEMLRALVAVRCDRCRVWDCLYHVLVQRDPDLLRRAVEKHKGCKQ